MPNERELCIGCGLAVYLDFLIVSVGVLTLQPKVLQILDHCDWRAWAGFQFVLFFPRLVELRSAELLFARIGCAKKSCTIKQAERLNRLPASRAESILLISIFRCC